MGSVSCFSAVRSHRLTFFTLLGSPRLPTQFLFDARTISIQSSQLQLQEFPFDCSSTRIVLTKLGNDFSVDATYLAKSADQTFFRMMMGRTTLRASCGQIRAGGSLPVGLIRLDCHHRGGSWPASVMWWVSFGLVSTTAAVLHFMTDNRAHTSSERALA